MNLTKLIETVKAASVERADLVEKLRDAATEHAGREAAERNSFPLRPSSALKSMRDLYYGLQNYYRPGSVKVDPVRNPILLSLGHAIEKHLVEWLERGFTVAHKNHRVTYGEIRRANGEVISLSGELDFCLVAKDGEVVICDSKSSGKWAFANASLPKEEHIAQINLYMHSQWARDLGIKRALVWYYCKDNSDVKCVEFNYNPLLAEATIARFQLAHDMYERGEIPAREHVLGLDWQAEYSSFKTHDNAEFEVPFEERRKIPLFSVPVKERPEVPLTQDAGDVIRSIATNYGNAVVNGYYLELGSKGLELKHVTEGTIKRSKKKYGT